ncbi:MAG: YbaN family protein [Fimbriimonadaceae bacterium]
MDRISRERPVILLDESPHQDTERLPSLPISLQVPVASPVSLEGSRNEEPLPSPTTQRRKLPRLGYLLLGLLCVGLGWIGVLVPGMPSTIFFIIALWAFQKSSPRLENWLLSNRIIGPTLRDWRESRSLRIRTKLVAITAIWVCIGASIFFLRSPWVIGLLVATALTLTCFLWSRKTKR